MASLLDILNSPAIRDMMRRYGVEPLPAGGPANSGYGLPPSLMARPPEVRIGKDEVAAGERGESRFTPSFVPEQYPMPPADLLGGGQSYGSGAGAISAANLEPLNVAGNRVGPSGPPLSMPMVGPQGIGDNASAMYGAKPAAKKSFVDDVLPTLWPALSRARDQSAMLHRERQNQEGWSDKVASVGQQAGLPPEMISLARFLGPTRGGELLSNFALEQAKGQRVQPDLVNLRDTQTNNTFAVSKTVAAAMVQGNPRRFTMAGTESTAPHVITMNRGPGTPTRTLNLSDPADMKAFNDMKAQGWSESKTPAATVNMNNSQEGAYAKTMGEGMAKEYLGLMDADRSAGLQTQKIDRLGSILGGLDTGSFSGTTTAIKAAAKSAGMDLEALGVTDDVAPAQAAKAMANEIALQLRNPSGGAGMPGALSDKDREFLMSMVPNIDTTPEGNKLLLDYWKKVNQRNRDVARLARDYKKRTGKYDEGFYDELSAYSDKNPLFANSPVAAEKSPKVVNKLPADAELGQDGYYRSSSVPGKRWKAQ